MGIHVLIVLIEIHFILVGIAEALDGEAVELDDIPVLQHARHQSDAAADIAHIHPCEIFQHGDVGCPETTLPNRRPVFSEDSDRKLKILVAEDNDSNFLLVRNILKDYDLLRVTNGVEAVEEIRNGKFDFVLMDLKMPVMDGLVATRKIREFNSDIPIVALTANAFDTDRASAMDAGCNAFLPKPVKRKQLFELLSGACR